MSHLRPSPVRAEALHTVIELLAQTGPHHVAAYAAWLCAAAFVSVSRSAHGERSHLWLAAGAALVGLCWMMLGNVAGSTPLVTYAELPWQACNALATCIAWVGVFGHMRIPQPWRRRLVIIVFAWAILALGFVLATLVSGLSLRRPVAFLPLALLSLVFAASGIWSARRQPGLGLLVLGVSQLVLPLTVIAGALTDARAPFLRYVHIACFLLACVVTLQGGYVREQRRLGAMRDDLRRAADELEQRVLKRTAELALARDLAQAGERAKSRFVAQMSHEIRTPISGLVGSLELLRQTSDPAEQGVLLAAAEASAGQLRLLLDRVLDLSKLDAGTLPMARKAFDLHALCQSALQPHRAAATAGALVLDLGDASRVVHGDALRISQVLDPLVANALDYADAGGVLVSVHTAPAQVTKGQPMRLTFEVADRGPGVTSERTESIFAPFEQGDGTDIADRPHGGAGLGLTFSRRLARAMGGDVTYEGREGGGSLFRVVLPVQSAVEDGLPAKSQVAGLPAVSRGGGARQPLRARRGRQPDDAGVAAPHLAPRGRARGGRR